MLSFFNYLQSLHPLSPDCQAALMKVIRPKELRRGYVWLQEGAICDKLTFIIKGLSKLYFESGSKEVCLQIAKENEFIFSVNSFCLQSPSAFTMRMIEPTVVVFILYNDWYNLLEKFPELNIHLRLLMQKQLCDFENHTSLLMLNQKERFDRLCSMYPWMGDGKRLTDRVVAAYLGMTPASLCGFKKV